MIGGVEDFVVGGMKNITGINHFLFSGALYTGINSMVSTWLITRQEVYQHDYMTVMKGAVIASSLTVSLSSLFDFPLKYSVNSTDLLPAMQRFIVGGALVGFIVSSPLTFTAKLIDKLVDRTFPDMPETLRSAGGSQELGYDWYPLHNAAALNQVQRAKVLLDSLDVETKKRALTESDTGDGGTYTVLTLAAFHGHKEMIVFLIAQYDELGISINSCDADGKTALMVAAAKGHIDIFQLFAEKYIERSISINEKDHYDNTAIHYITATSLYSSPSSEQMISYQEIISVLINNGVNINALNYYGKTALGMVARRNADSVTAHKIAENLDLAHLIAKLLDEDPDISTLMKRMENSNVKSNMGNEKATAILLLKNDANPLETEYFRGVKSQVMQNVKQDDIFMLMLKKALCLTEDTSIEFDLTKNNDKLYIGLATFNNVNLLDSDGHSKDELSTLNETELSDFLSDLQYRYMICLWDDSIDCILS